jgi:hypothetical protein
MRTLTHRRLPPSLEDLIHCQAGIVTRRQALGHGLSRHTISSYLNGGRWQTLYPHRGVYSTFTGPLQRVAELWAAVLACGTGAMFSHHTAAELWGITERPSSLIHVTKPHRDSIEGPRGVRIHYSTRAEQIRHPAASPPRTRLEETIIELTQISHDLDEAAAWISRACGSRLTTPSRLAVALNERKKLSWRDELTDMVTEAAEGSHSLLESRYLRRVERAHGLPRGLRQLRRVENSASRYDDVTYEAYRTIVHLDGRTGHHHEDAFRDMRRDNASAERENVPLRYGYGDVTHRPCEVAAQVARVLIARGWTASPITCGPACPVFELYGSTPPITAQSSGSGARGLR